MKKLLLSAAFSLVAGSALAAVTAQQLVSAYQSEGFTAIEVVTGATQIKVEAVRNGTKLEVIYDAASGAIVKQEQRPARARDANDSSIEVSTTTVDFTNANGQDLNDDHGRGRGRDDGPGHDLNDDHGGDRDDSASDDSLDDGSSGRDHSGRDHSGRDDSGRDDDRDDDHSGHGRGGDDRDDDDNDDDDKGGKGGKD